MRSRGHSVTALPLLAILALLSACTTAGPATSTAAPATSTPVTASTAAAATAQAQATPATDLPIIDVHFHASSAWDPAALVRLFDRLGVTRAGNGPQGADALWDRFTASSPQRFIPFAGQSALQSLILEHKEAAWELRHPDVVRYVDGLEAALRAGRIRGIGEVFPNNLKSTPPTNPRPTRYPADSPLMRRLWELSATYKVPMSVHMEAEPSSIAEMERLVASDRAGTWIWAHAGHYADAALVRRLLQTHPNVYVELSWREGIRPRAANTPIDRSGVLDPAWKALFEELPDRFLLGTDVSAATEEAYAAEVAYWRQILGQLPPSTAAKLANENAVRLFRLPRP